MDTRPAAARRLWLAIEATRYDWCAVLEADGARVLVRLADAALAVAVASVRVRGDTNGTRLQRIARARLELTGTGWTNGGAP